MKKLKLGPDTVKWRISKGQKKKDNERVWIIGGVWTRLLKPSREVAQECIAKEEENCGRETKGTQPWTEWNIQAHPLKSIKVVDVCPEGF